jgi:hypothetical protein
MSMNPIRPQVGGHLERADVVIGAVAVPGGRSGQRQRPGQSGDHPPSQAHRNLPVVWVSPQASETERAEVVTAL